MVLIYPIMRSLIILSLLFPLECALEYLNPQMAWRMKWLNPGQGFYHLSQSFQNSTQQEVGLLDLDLTLLSWLIYMPFKLNHSCSTPWGDKQISNTLRQDPIGLFSFSLSFYSPTWRNILNPWSPRCILKSRHLVTSHMHLCMCVFT